MSRSKRKTPPGVGEYSFGCPYCGSVLTGEISQTTIIIGCPKCSEKKEWHEGIFKAHL